MFHNLSIWEQYLQIEMRLVIKLGGK